MIQLRLFSRVQQAFWGALLLLGAISSVATSSLAASAPAKRPAKVSNVPKVIAYVPNWVDLNLFAPTIDYAKLTHINIAFENPIDDSGTLSFNRANEVLIEKAHAHGVPVSLSIGGGLASTDKDLLARYSTLLERPKRGAFVAQLSAYLDEHNFDGLDVDIEGPAIGKDYGAFIAELSRTLRPKGKLLTAALSQGYGGNQVPDSVFEQLDWVNIMAYDGKGPWNPDAPGQHSSLEFARSNVEYWLKRGLSKSKAVMGVPFYGYGFGEAFSPREYPYSKIIELHPNAEQMDQVGNTIWYNGIATIKAKAQYAREQGLAGVMIWSLDSDAKGEHSLLSALHQSLNKP